MFDKNIRLCYPAFAADRLGYYNDIQGRASENPDYEATEPRLEWPAPLWFWLRNKLGALIAALVHEPCVRFRGGRPAWMRATHHRLLRTRAFVEWEVVTCAC